MSKKNKLGKSDAETGKQEKLQNAVTIAPEGNQKIDHHARKEPLGPNTKR